MCANRAYSGATYTHGSCAVSGSSGKISIQHGCNDGQAVTYTSPHNAGRLWNNKGDSMPHASRRAQTVGSTLPRESRGRHTTADLKSNERGSLLTQTDQQTSTACGTSPTKFFYLLLENVKGRGSDEHGVRVGQKADLCKGELFQICERFTEKQLKSCCGIAEDVKDGVYLQSKKEICVEALVPSEFVRDSRVCNGRNEISEVSKLSLEQAEILEAVDLNSRLDFFQDTNNFCFVEKLGKEDKVLFQLQSEPCRPQDIVWYNGVIKWRGKLDGRKGVYFEVEDCSEGDKMRKKQHLVAGNHIRYPTTSDVRSSAPEGCASSTYMREKAGRRSPMQGVFNVVSQLRMSRIKDWTLVKNDVWLAKGEMGAEEIVIYVILHDPRWVVGLQRAQKEFKDLSKESSSSHFEEPWTKGSEGVNSEREWTENKDLIRIVANHCKFTGKTLTGRLNHGVHKKTSLDKRVKSETSHPATSTYLGNSIMESKNKSTTSPKLSGIKCDQSLDIEKESDLSYSTAHPWPAVSSWYTVKQFHSKRHGILRRVLRFPDQKNEMAVVEIDGDLPKGWQNALEVCRQGDLVMECEKELALVPLYAIYDDLLTERVGATVEPIFQDGTGETGDKVPDSGTELTPCPPSSIISNLVGKWKGVQGKKNSCYMDSTIYAMFVQSTAFDELLQYDKKSVNDPKNQFLRVLATEVVYPLRKFAIPDILFLC
ncbi:unnamed protein product [Enterobius vermicularis]|uniref:Histone-lysine N-methyltransferase ATX2 n=1 Tax=Enterobius vermicularis TaxID=51028 RepID=A0A0N4V1H5_ENTVE|nr:unnamed protein product [Enterobius vermicularis]